MNGVLDAVVAGGCEDQAVTRSNGCGAPIVVDRPSPRSSSSVLALDLQLSELEATIDTRLARYRRREWLWRVSAVPASVGAAAMVLWQLSAGLA